MCSVLILMDMPLFPYRIYAYNELAAKRGYDVTVISASNEDAVYSIDMKFKHIRLGVKSLGPFFLLENFAKLKMSDYDYIIVTPNLRCLSFYPLLFGHRHDNNLLAWGHLKGCTSGNRLAASIRMRICKKMQSIIFYEAGTRDEFVAAGYDAEKLFVANNTQYVNPQTVHLGLEKEYFLYVGRIQTRKGLSLALKAYAKFVSENPNCDLKFKIVGGGDKTELKALCDLLRITDKVEFEGAVHEENKLGDIFAHAIAYVSPGHVGLGVLHSLAFGVPVITCTGRLHSVEFSNCKPNNSFVVPFNVDGIAEAMHRLASDNVLQQKMSHAAYDYYNEYCTIDKMVDGIDEAINYVHVTMSNIEHQRSNRGGVKHGLSIMLRPKVYQMKERRAVA